MLKETPYELLVGHCYMDGLASAVIPGIEGHLRIRDFHYAAVGYGYTMGIAAEVINGISKTVESLLDVGTPVLPVQGVPERVPFTWDFKTCAVFWKHKEAVLIKSVK